MNITYLHHSAFLVELDQHVLLFDWVNTPLPPLPKDKQLYVFASHIHGDHYDPAIYQLMEEHPDVRYFISSDIPSRRLSQILLCAPNQTYERADITIETLTSTDEGVAFVITCEGHTLYFAGDLNWWDWGEEDSAQAAMAMENAYRMEMKKLTKKHFDVAFLPVDPRLTEGYYKGVTCFMEYSDATHIFPMHFWNRPTIIETLKERLECAPYRDRIIGLRKDMETFTIL